MSVAKILVTRPSYSVVKTLEDYTALGLEALHAPMLDIEPVNFDPVDMATIGGFIFTSKHAIRCFTDKMTIEEEIKQPAFCVGTTTADIALKSGFKTVHNAEHNVEALIEMIADIYKNFQLPLLYVRGEHIKSDLASVPELSQLKIKDCITYDAESVKDFSSDVLQALQNNEVGIVSFYSGRTAENFKHLIQKNGLEQQIERIKILCISKSVLEYASDLKWDSTHISDEPNHESMLEKARTLIETNET